MVRHKAILIALLVLACLGNYIECKFFGKADKDPYNDKSSEKLGKQFKELNRLLIEKTASSNAVINLRIIERLIPDAESSTFMGIKNKKSLVKAKKLLVSLRKLEYEEMCNRLGGAIVTRISKAIRNAGSNVGRIEEIFTYYLDRQEDVCLRVFPKILEKKLALMDEAKLKRLDYIMERAMNKHCNKKTRADGLFLLISMNYVGPSPISLYETVTNFAETKPDDPKLQKDLSPEELNDEVVSRYLVEPCDHLLDYLAKDLFDLASNWARIHKPDQNQVDFYYNWARYMFCRDAYKIMKI